MGIQDFPQDKLPTCWSDDVRMNALFAPFRLKVANPESWEMKVKFWSDMLRQWCRHKKNPIITASDCQVAFQRNGRSPACIDIVVEECLRNGDLSPVSKYLQLLHSGPEGWVSWGARLAFKPAAIAVTTIASLLPFKQAIDQDGLPKASIDLAQRFVLECALKEQATQLLTEYPTGVERFGTIEELMQITKYTSMDRETFELMLGYLVSQGHAVKKGNIIKLADPGEKVTPLQESEGAMHRLLASERKLITDADKHSREADRALEEARVAMKLGNKGAAKNHLRRKHRYAEQAATSQSALENVRHLMDNMRQVEVNSAVVDTYRMSADVMKRGMRDSGLTEDSAMDTMDELREVLESYGEVERTLASGVEDCNLEELEMELQELLDQPGAPPEGGTPAKDDRAQAKDVKKPTPSKEKTRKLLERDYVFDGEERMMAELNDLSLEDKSLDKKKKKSKAAVTEPSGGGEGADDRQPQKEPRKNATKPWYPTKKEFVSNPWTEPEEKQALDKSFDALRSTFAELRTDDRLHPGQKLVVDFGRTARLFKTDFQVQDHIVQDDGIWLYNCKEGNQHWQEEEDFDSSTEYQSGQENSDAEDETKSKTNFSTDETPQASSSGFQMAPGGERSKDARRLWPAGELEEVERRLRNLRGFNL